MLAGDADERVRALLARKLGLLVPALSAGGQSRLRQQTLDTLTALAEDATVRVRAAIADAVKDLPEAPRAIILRLAHDAEMMVCEPVIRFSPLLTTDDLVSLVAAAPSSGTGVAVARRAAIDAAVSDAIAAGGTDDAVLALLMNGSAQIREATLDALVERSIDHPDWHDPLVRRPALSDQSAKTLSRIVADHCSRCWRHAAISIRRWRPICAQRCRPGCGTATAAPEPAAQPGRTTEADLLAAARDGDARKAAVMLATASACPIARGAPRGNVTERQRPGQPGMEGRVFHASRLCDAGPAGRPCRLAPPSNLGRATVFRCRCRR